MNEVEGAFPSDLSQGIYTNIIVSLLLNATIAWYFLLISLLYMTSPIRHPSPAPGHLRHSNHLYLQYPGFAPPPPPPQNTVATVSAGILD